jgi:hypothetical protein
MKHLTKAILALFSVCVFTVMAIAQDSAVSSTNTTITTEQHTWYTQPWVWIVGGIVLLLLIIALVRGGGSSASSSTDKVTYTKTTETDNP